MKNIFAVIAEGEDSFVALTTPIGQMPLVFTDESKIERFRELIKGAAIATGKKCYVVRFSFPTVMEVINEKINT